MIKKCNLQIGDRVAYSKNFLKSTGQYTGDIPFARGIVTAIQFIAPTYSLVTVDWNNTDIPGKVCHSNLVKIKHIAADSTLN